MTPACDRPSPTSRGCSTSTPSCCVPARNPTGNCWRVWPKGDSGAGNRRRRCGCRTRCEAGDQTGHRGRRRPLSSDAATQPTEGAGLSVALIVTAVPRRELLHAVVVLDVRERHRRGWCTAPSCTWLAVAVLGIGTVGRLDDLHRPLLGVPRLALLSHRFTALRGCPTTPAGSGPGSSLSRLRGMFFSAMTTRTRLAQRSTLGSNRPPSGWRSFFPSQREGPVFTRAAVDICCGESAAGTTPLRWTTPRRPRSERVPFPTPPVRVSRGSADKGSRPGGGRARLRVISGVSR